MRTIKFKGKRIISGEWKYGDLYQKIIDGDMRTVISWHDKDGFRNSVWVEPETVSQYIGLNDKNKEEIYENHIVELEVFYESESTEIYIDGTYIGQIVIIPSKGVCLKNPFFRNNDGDDYKTNFYKPIAAYRSKIIGNIFDNPELLK